METSKDKEHTEPLSRCGLTARAFFSVKWKVSEQKLRQTGHQLKMLSQWQSTQRRRVSVTEGPVPSQKDLPGLHVLSEGWKGRWGHTEGTGHSEGAQFQQAHAHAYWFGQLAGYLAV